MAQADQLVDLMGKLAPYNPQIAIVMMDLVIAKMAASYSKVKPTVTALPKEEAAPAGVDVVIILGSDFSESY